MDQRLEESDAFAAFVADPAQRDVWEAFGFGPAPAPIAIVSGRPTRCRATRFVSPGR